MLPEKRYRVREDYKQWKAGEIVAIRGILDDPRGVLEEVPSDTPYNHVVIVVDPLTVTSHLKQHG